MNSRRIGMLAGSVAALLLANGSASINSAQAASKAFTMKASKRSVSVSGGGSVSLRVSVKQPSRVFRPMSYKVSSKLKQVSLSTADESATGATVLLVASPAATKQKGFVDVVARSGDISKRVRFSVTVVPGKGPVVNQPGVTVAATTVVATPQTTQQSTPQNPTPGSSTTPASTVAVTTGPPKPAGDFALTVDVGTKTVPLGDTGTVLVIVSGSGGYSGTPEFDVFGAPAGVLPQFDQPKSKTGSKLTFNVSANAPRGNYPITIGATDGSIRRTVPLVLAVRKYTGMNLSVNMPSLVAPGVTVPVEVFVSPTIPGDDVPPLTAIVSAGFQTAEVSLAENQKSVVLNLTVPVSGSEVKYPVIISVQTASGGYDTKYREITVTNDLKFAFTSGTTVTAETRLFGGTVTGTYSLPISAREVFGAQPKLGSCGSTPTGLIASLSGSGTSYQLSFSASLLPLGSYTVSCGISMGNVDTVMTGTFIAKFKPLVVNP